MYGRPSAPARPLGRRRRGLERGGPGRDAPSRRRLARLGVRAPRAASGELVRAARRGREHLLERGRSEPAREDARELELRRELARRERERLASRRLPRGPRPDPSHPVAYYGEASRAARSSAASQSSGDRHSASDLPDAPTFEVGEDARGATSNPRPGAPARTRAAPEHPSRRASRDHHHPDERRPDERRRKPRGSTPQAWVRVADVIESTRAAESALKRRADEPARLAPTYRDAEAQTEVANLGVGNPNAQLKFQAALQTELRECQDALAEAQMRAKAAARDKERLQAELEEAIARRGAWAKSAPPGGGGGGGGGEREGTPPPPATRRPRRARRRRWTTR